MLCLSENAQFLFTVQLYILLISMMDSSEENDLSVMKIKLRCIQF